MDYEKKYKEALERARKLYNDAKANEYKSDMEDYEYIFPQLAESEDEDERIRKCLWDIVNWLGFDSIFFTNNSVTKNDAIVWLERQKEQNLIMAKSPQLKEQKSGLSVVGVLQSKTPQGPIKLAEWKEEAKIREWILAKMQELAATGVPCSDEIKMADKAIDYLIK